jgi:hypothetical protein
MERKTGVVFGSLDFIRVRLMTGIAEYIFLILHW